ncbi:MAG: hypothetical protein HWN65_11780 [Candidatus Helarchaeota archaeon]|nr:hypothetical protein [Candidatus Helarchaeota archaeon]
MKFNGSSIEKTGLLAARLFGYVEVFILFGIQFFWIVYSGNLISNESLGDFFVILGPILMTVLVGFICQVEYLRVAIRKIEYVIHLLICGIILTIILLLQTRNEFNPIIPFTWLFHLWVIFFGLVLISNIASNMDKRPLLTYLKERNQFILLLGLGGVIGAVTLGIVAILQYPVYYWITAVIFHAIMILISVSRQYTNSEELSNGPQNPSSYTVFKNLKEMFSISSFKMLWGNLLIIIHNFFRALFYLVSFVISWILWGFHNQIVGAIEENYILVSGIFLSPIFYAGIVLGIGLMIIEVKKKVKISLLGDIICVLILGLSFLEIYFMSPFVLGYILVMMFLLGSKQNPINHAIAITFVQIAWFGSLVLFAFSTILIGLGVGGFINLVLFGIAGGILGLALIFFALDSIFKHENGEITENTKNMEEFNEE